MTDDSITSPPIKKIIESMLFAVNEPLSVKKMCEALHSQGLVVTSEDAEGYLKELSQEYTQQRTFHIAKISDGYLLRTNEEFRPFIDALFKKKHSERLSQASLEVISIIAFRQPVTRAQIEEIRGVDSSGIIQTLLDRELVYISGKLEVPGRPALFSVTKDFLTYFGLNDLADLNVNINEPIAKLICPLKSPF